MPIGTVAVVHEGLGKLQSNDWQGLEIQLAIGR
jgi:hypothetical protein